MSRIGKLAIDVPKNIIITKNIDSLTNKEKIQIKGSITTLTQEIPKEISVEIKESSIIIHKKLDNISANQKYGLIRSLIKNMVLGVEKKFEKKLQMIGVGYKAQLNGKELIINVGYTHPILFSIPDGIEILVEGNSNLIIRGSDKNVVGLLASQIRATRPPEPYKGKGVRYSNEIIIRKVGKSGK